MKEKEKIIEHLLKKYGYKRGQQPSIYSKSVNNRMRKMMEEFLLFYDEDKEKLEQKVKSAEKNLKYMFEFIQKYGLEDKWKKECLKELII